MSSFELAYRTPFIAAMIGIVVLASVWVIYEQFREPTMSILICPEGTENNGNNICLCTDPHTTTVTIDGTISCLMIGPSIPDFDLCTVVPEHPKCTHEKPGLPIKLSDDILEKINGAWCKDHPESPDCNIVVRPDYDLPK